jgi:hypothetical protein
MVETEVTPAVNLLRRLAAATWSPHYGGVDPDTVEDGGFSLPGGGMGCRSLGSSTIVITVYSFGGLARAWASLYVCEDGAVLGWTPRCDSQDTAVRPWGEDIPGVAPSRYVNWGYAIPLIYATEGHCIEPRSRDIDRLKMWVCIAGGMDSYDAAQLCGMGNNVGHAHAGIPPADGEPSPMDSVMLALRANWRWTDQLNLNIQAIFCRLYTEIRDAGYDLPCITEQIVQSALDGRPLDYNSLLQSLAVSSIA